MRVRRGALLAIAAAAALVAAAAGVRALARSRTHQLFGELVARVETPRRVVALTFDDGPTDSATARVLAALGERGARGTFYLIGREVAERPELARRIAAAGHELGNHTYDHERMVLRSPGFIRHQIEATDSLLRAAGAAGAITVRPPYGYRLLGLPWFLARTGRTTVTWDVEPDSYPAVAATAEGIVAHVLERARPGSIVLLHVMYPSRATSLAAVPGIVDGLTARGYELVTVSELLALRGR